MLVTSIDRTNSVRASRWVVLASKTILEVQAQIFLCVFSRWNYYVNVETFHQVNARAQRGVDANQAANVSSSHPSRRPPAAHSRQRRVSMSLLDMFFMHLFFNSRRMFFNIHLIQFTSGQQLIHLLKHCRLLAYSLPCDLRPIDLFELIHLLLQISRYC